MACSTLARQDAVENGRTMPVVPRIEMPPMMPSLALVVLRAIRSPPGTEITTRTPEAARSTASPTACVIIARGTGLIAGAPSSRPRPGLVTTPTPTPPSSSIPAGSRQLTVAVRCAPCVTSGSSPASLTTTASACSARMQDHDAGLDREPDARPGRQRDLHVACDLTGAQRGRRGLGRRRGTGPGGPAGAQRAPADLGCPRQVRLAQLGTAHGPPPSRARRSRRAPASARRKPWK